MLDSERGSGPGPLRARDKVWLNECNKQPSANSPQGDPKVTAIRRKVRPNIKGNALSFGCMLMCHLQQPCRTDGTLVTPQKKHQLLKEAPPLKFPTKNLAGRTHEMSGKILWLAYSKNICWHQ